MNTAKISHFGILVHDADAATKLWTETFGLRKFEDMIIDAEGIRSVFISPNGNWNEMVIEIMEPLDKKDMNNALSRRLATQGEGFYHVCLMVDDVPASGQELRDRGFTVMMRDPVKPGDPPRWLMHPKQTNGVMVESISRSPQSAP